MTDKKERKARKPLKPKQILRKLAEEEAIEQEKDVMYKYGVGEDELEGAEHI